jgi:hypothetical protein
VAWVTRAGTLVLWCGTVNIGAAADRQFHLSIGIALNAHMMWRARRGDFGLGLLCTARGGRPLLELCRRGLDISRSGDLSRGPLMKTAAKQSPAFVYVIAWLVLLLLTRPSVLPPIFTSASLPRSSSSALRRPRRRWSSSGLCD